MKIALFTMQWPAWSETSVIRDFQTLYHHPDCDVRVMAMRPAPKNAQTILKSYGIENIKSQSATIFKLIKSIGLILLNISLFLLVICKILKNEKRLIEQFKSLCLLPISFYYWNDIRRHNYDIVHFYWGHYPSLVGLLLKKSGWQGVMSMTFTAYDLRMDYGVSRAVGQFSDQIFTVSEYNKNILISRGCDGKKIKVVYGGLELQKTDLDKRRNEKDMVFVGRLVKTKGIFELITAFNQIDDPNMRLHIIGDGPDKVKIESLSDPRVVFHGRLNTEQVMNILKNSGILIHPSHVEMLPNVIKEAMMAGAIVISSKTHGIDEIITHGKNGFLVDYDDISGIAKIAKDVITMNNTEKQQIRRSALKTIETQFDCVRNMEYYVACWKDKIR